MSEEEGGQRLPDGGDVFLRGGLGVPTLRISDHYEDRELRYRQQLREVKDAEIKDLLAKVEKAETVRRMTPPLRVGQLKAAVAAMQARRENERFERRADALELPLLEAWAAANAPPPAPPPPTRYGKALSAAGVAHEEALAAAQVKTQAAAMVRGCGTCWQCQTGQRCVYKVGS
jgi:hypothetical protein